MMKRKISLCIIVFLFITACFVSPTYVFDGNDYDYGGSDDYDYDYDDYDYDYDSGGSSGSGGGASETSSLIVSTIVMAILMFYVFNKNKNKYTTTPKSSREGQVIKLPDRTVEIENIMKEHDPNFSASDFISFVKRIYIDIQTAWCKRNLEPVRIFLHDNLYDATMKQIQAKIDQGVVYHYESMVVNTAFLTSYAKDAQFEYLTVYLNARMIDWQEDEKTGKILRGDKTTRWDLRYKMKFMRSTEVLTAEETEALKGHSCPSCAAPLEMTSSGKCTYCGAIITTGKYKWVLSDFGTIRNDTVDEGINV